MIEDILPARYELTGQKFSGGQGDVFICHDNQLERDVAIKYVPTKKLKYGLVDEINALTSMSSKHVVEVYDVLKEHGQIVALVEEYVPGSDLSEYHKTTHSTSDYLKTLYQIANGLSDIHKCGHIHRDIKPSNIKLDAEGVVKILDFGLSNPDDDAVTTRKHGTLGYYAPEMFEPGSVVLDSSIDVYAFGVTCWSLITGSLPRELYQHPPQSTNRVPSIKSIVPDLDQNAVDIIDACLSIDSTARPSMEAVSLALARSVLKGKHRGVLVRSTDDAQYQVNSSSPRVRVGSELRNIVIEYTGYAFQIASAVGDVFVNNIPASVGAELPGSSVLTLGASELKAQRAFFAFEISHPEVVL